jgi:predicted Zn-dependent protease with MMP-like domain
MRRMSLRKFGRIVTRVMETLPDAFRPYLDNLVVDVEEEPDERTLRDLDFTDAEITEGGTLYGLFVPSLFDTGELSGVDEHDLPPHRIIIYKRPLEEDFPDPRELRTESRKTVIHELAHHFGYTDKDLEAFDDDPDPFGGEVESEP